MGISFGQTEIQFHCLALARAIESAQVRVMLSRIVLISVALLFSAGTALRAQETAPPVYLGPYLQPSAAQFVGEWTRSDGTYKFKISEEEGALKAIYLNPMPINVESTTMDKSETGLLIRIVLRDEGYPGSIYELEYIPQYRVLAGYYTIPGQEPSQVYFMR